MHVMAACAAGLVVGCATCQHAVKEAPHPKHVVFVGWDGCTGSAITQATLPNLTKLRENGSWTLKSRSILPSSSSCNWHSILTCSAAEQHGYNDWNSTNAVFEAMAVTENGKYPDLFYQYRKLKSDAEIGFFYEWRGMFYTADTTMCSHCEQAAPTNITDKVCAYIRTKKPDFLFVAYDRPDHEGHVHGWGSPKYLQAVERLDAELGRILQALEDAGMREDTVIVVSSDHGGSGKGHGKALLSHMERPVVIQGPGIRKGCEMTFIGTVYDTGATLGALLGIEFPACWIGRPYIEAFE